MLPVLSISASLAISWCPVARAHSSAASISRRPTPRPRRSWSTYQPSMNATGDEEQPGAYFRKSSSRKPMTRLLIAATKTIGVADRSAKYARVSASWSDNDPGQSASRRRSQLSRSLSAIRRTISPDGGSATSQNLFEPLGRPRQDRPAAFLDDRSLNQVGMLD